MPLIPHIALVGNPNSGKSSLFNALTGLRQKVGNYAGVTVEKKTGTGKIAPGKEALFIDLPGTYSLYPKSIDEQVTFDIILNPAAAFHPSLIVIVADASNLKRNLLFCSQIIDLNTPVIIALTMMDMAREKGITVDVAGLSQKMGVPVVPINPRKGTGIAELKKTIEGVLHLMPPPPPPFIDLEAIIDGDTQWLEEIRQLSNLKSRYAALPMAGAAHEFKFLPAAARIHIAALAGEHKFQKSKVQAAEVLARYKRIDGIMKQCVVQESGIIRAQLSERIDKWLLHPLWGNAFLLLVLLLLFQCIFTVAKIPSEWLQQGFSALGSAASSFLPPGILNDLVVNGLIGGMGSVMVFVPQIMLLFGFITVLEDSGYMARISFLTDRLMRMSGLNGRSVMPLISGMACAVPAIMATRTIRNRKERLITLLITPLMSCSARLPVYTLLIDVVIPDHKLWGFVSLQAVVMLGLYLLGFFMALIVAKGLDIVLKNTEKPVFLIELPDYRAPRWRNVGFTMFQKAGIFVKDVGKVIVALTLVLLLFTHIGPPGSMDNLSRQYSGKELEKAQLEHSYAGMVGKAIEPVIRPLGFDWKIGIALLTSFAAREVFVSTMATLYSVGEDNTKALSQKLHDATTPAGKPVYSLGTGISLLLFYVFAMQCMSTLAVVKRETRSWKFAAFQFAYMLVLAYMFSWVAYSVLGK